MMKRKIKLTITKTRVRTTVVHDPYASFSCPERGADPEVTMAAASTAFFEIETPTVESVRSDAQMTINQINARTYK